MGKNRYGGRPSPVSGVAGAGLAERERHETSPEQGRRRTVCRHSPRVFDKDRIGCGSQLELLLDELFGVCRPPPLPRCRVYVSLPEPDGRVRVNS